MKLDITVRNVGLKDEIGIGLVTLIDKYLKSKGADFDLKCPDDSSIMPGACKTYNTCMDCGMCRT